MDASARHGLFMAVLVGCTLTAFAGEPVATGKALFERDWVTNPPRTGDGIGPLFNDVSCVACHHQGGVGGAGANEHNVTVLALSGSRSRTLGTLRRLGVSVEEALQESLKSLHPSFVAPGGSLQPAFVLHSRGSDDYARFRREFFERSGIDASLDVNPHAIARRPVIDAFSGQTGGASTQVNYKIEQRSTTPLFGLGLIEAIPASVIQQQYKLQTAQKSVISGRPALVNGELARFGWRLQVATLKDFISEACATEMGLQTPDHAQAADPMRNGYTLAAGETDMSGKEVAALTHFVASLPAPRPVLPRDPQAREQVKEGRHLFAAVGCATCHVPDMGPAKQIYSDLLLHDMGPFLEGANPAPPFVVKRRVVPQSTALQLASRSGSPSLSSRQLDSTSTAQLSTTTSGYYGTSSSITMADSPPRRIVRPLEDAYRVSRSGRPMAMMVEEIIEPTLVKREWRTPPLWGVADSAPYMHDGRAATLLEAVAMHGGEAVQSRDALLDLPVDKQQRVIAFLETLVAPRSHPLTTAVAMQ